MPNRPVYSQVCIKDPFEAESSAPEPKLRPPKTAVSQQSRRPVTKQPVVIASSSIKSPDMVTSSQMPGKQCSIDAFFSRSNIDCIGKGTPVKDNNNNKNQPKSGSKPVAAVKPHVQSLISSFNPLPVEKQEKPQIAKKFSFNPKTKNQ